MQEFVELKYALSEEDYLQYNLFLASQKNDFLRKKQFGRFFVGGLYIVFGVYFFLVEMALLYILFFLFGIAWMVFYPLRIKYMYERHFQKYIQQNLKENLDKEGVFSIQKGKTTLTSQGQEFNFTHDQIAGIDCFPGYSLIRVNGGQTAIIPEKKVSAADLERVFEIILNDTGIQPKRFPEWKW